VREGGRTGGRGSDGGTVRRKLLGRIYMGSIAEKQGGKVERFRGGLQDETSDVEGMVVARDEGTRRSG